MNDKLDFSSKVLEAIHANRKIEAIKLLREEHGLGLKEAKHAVENYIRENPHLIAENESSNGINAGCLILIVAIIFIVYILYSIFTK